MKLSKAQQAVVDKMREGWELRFNTKVNSYYLLAPKFLRRRNTTYNAFQGLFEMGAIIFDYADNGILIYRLTEQYKTANNENSNTGDTTE